MKHHETLMLSAAHHLSMLNHTAIMLSDLAKAGDVAAQIERIEAAMASVENAQRLLDHALHYAARAEEDEREQAVEYAVEDRVAARRERESGNV